ncbi:MAG: carboxypeptidase-like regulatory domain-containing protein [Thermoanaerobaculia bacterium]
MLVDHQDYAPLIVHSDHGASSNVILSRGSQIRGRVTGDGIYPPGPGRVCATWTPAMKDAKFEVHRCGDVAADGTWLLGALPDGTLHVEVKVPAYLPLTFSIPATEAEWSGRLEPGLRIAIGVEDSNGKPATGARVECKGSMPAVTGSRGESVVSMAGMPSLCQAFADGDGETSESSLIDPHAANPSILHMKRGAFITATLLSDDGAPLSTPHFVLLEDHKEFGWGAVPVEPRSYSGSRVRILVPPNERRALRIENAATLPLTSDWFQAAAGQTVDLGVLVLRRGGGVQGELIDGRSGKPLRGAVVTLEPQGMARVIFGKLGRGSAVSGDDGRFAVTGLPIASYRARIDCDGFTPTEWVVDLNHEQIVDVGLKSISPGVRFAGKVERSEETPLPGAQIRLLPDHAVDGEPTATFQTSSDGTWRPVTVSPGRYRMLIYAPDLMLDQEIELRADREPTDMNIRVGMTTLSGLVLRNGVPVNGGEVLIDHASSRTGYTGVAVARSSSSGAQLWVRRQPSVVTATVDSTGHFTVPDLVADSVVIDVFGRSSEHVTRTLQLPHDREASVRIDLAGFDLSGHLFEAETGVGLAGVVEVVDQDGIRVASEQCDQSGIFVVRGLEAGNYSVAARVAGHTPAAIAQVRLDNVAAAPIELPMKRATEAGLDVAIQRETAIPAAGVSMAVVDELGRQVRALATRMDGIVAMSQIPVGKVYVVTSDPLFGVGVSAPIVLHSGFQTAGLTLEAGKDVVLRCEGFDCAGEKVGMMKIATRSGIDVASFLLRSEAITYSNDGTANIGRLAPGTYDVTFGSGSRSLHAALDIGRGPGEVQLTVPKK